MTDKEYIKNISSISTEDLFNSLEYYGYDSYYAELWEATIEELKKRIGTRPQGKWLKYGVGGFKCSICGRGIATSISEENPSKDYPFCHCGADMRKGGRKNE